MTKPKGIIVSLSSRATLPDGYYSLALPVLKEGVDLCKQAGISIPPQNEIRHMDGVELEGVFCDLGSGIEFSCRAARYDNVEHKIDVGIVVMQKTRELDGRALISVLYEPLPQPGNWSQYSQVQRGCRSEAVETLCDRLEIDWLKVAKKELDKHTAFSRILSAAQWAARQMRAAC